MVALNWVILVVFLGGLLAWVLLGARRPTADREALFFRGADVRGQRLGGVGLTATLLISWVFAKSVQNAADLGQGLGLPGGVAYATYWLSFLVAGWVIFRMRGSGFRSIHHFLASRFGVAAVWVFSLVLLFRLWNEVWSNTMVVAQFFGPTGSGSFLAAAWATTILVLGYSLVSGFRGSIVTDFLQMGLAAVVLGLILLLVLPRADVGELATSGSWTLSGGVDLLLVALIQCFSYPFHDPVMTDRGFITDRTTTLKGFIAAGLLGVVFITLFSLLGVHGGVAGIEGNSTFGTAAALGLPALLLGGLMVHAGPAILSATTVSGTMVIGLTPVFTLWWWKRPGRASYLSSVGIGVALGIGLALGWIPGSVGDGNYGNLLFVNIVGVAACFLAFVGFAVVAPSGRPTPPTPSLSHPATTFPS